MPSHGPTRPDALLVRIKVQFSAAQNEAVTERADALGMTVAGYLRSLALQDLSLETTPRKPTARQIRDRAMLMQVAEFHALAMQVKRLGVTVNQLAKQANTGMVPLSRTEVLYMLNQHQILMSHAKAAVEKMLA